jgi:hypothetical protein
MFQPSKAMRDFFHPQYFSAKCQLVKVPEHIRCFASSVAAKGILPLSLSTTSFFCFINTNFVIFLMMLVVCNCIVCFVSFCFSYAMLWSVLCMSAQKPALLLFCAVSCRLTDLQTSCWKSNAFLTHLWNICGTARKLRTSLYFQKVSHE